ncbi:LPXTG-site transpeptidase (sortase) family protein [Actinokineospora terrae]|uniref:LPXTG-site transpeptidase (Sortase) family protein n=1 Tax=Actinokineospora terrae TaxID=155974 RepID=A0A1H9WSH7_9PSEU|nr:LPXTG-site transpeptidase (sortase) family protein [Actinokineospora terrae]
MPDDRRRVPPRRPQDPEAPRPARRAPEPPPERTRHSGSLDGSLDPIPSRPTSANPGPPRPAPAGQPPPHGRPATGQSANGRPATSQPANGRPTHPPRPVNGQPLNGRPIRPATGRPAADRPAAGRPPHARAHPAEARTELIPPVTDDDPTEFIRAHRGSLGYRDPETERIRPAGQDEPDDRVHLDDLADYDDHDDDNHDPDHDDEFDDDPPPPRRKESVASVIVRSVGEIMVTLGVIVLLFVVYEVWVTDLVSAEKQEDVTVALDDQWQHPGPADPQRQQKFEFADGEGMAKLYIPALGDDYHFTIVEGTSAADLETGPGHYKKSALPGQPGNFAVAGHRVGKGAPFNDLDLLSSCDAIVVETQTSWFVYRMLPTSDDAKNWAAKAADPRCAGVAPQTGDYARATGRQIVTPQQSEVVAPVPGNPSAKTPAEQRQKMITLTTCHPKFSNRQRMVLQGVLVREQPKNAAAPTEVPAELRETA